MQSELKQVMDAMERAIMKVIPKEFCPIKEQKNQWKRDRLRESIGNCFRVSYNNGPQQTKDGVLERV